MSIVKGGDKLVQVTLKKKNLSTGVMDPYDLTGYGKIQVIFKGTYLVTVSSLDTPNRITVVNAILGRFTFRIDKTVTANLREGKFSFDVLVTDSAGQDEIWQFENVLDVKNRIS